MRGVGAALTRSPAPAFAEGPWAAAAGAAMQHAPYLKRLIGRRPDLLHDASEDLPQRLLKQALADAYAIASSPPTLEEGMRSLRRAKDAVHLATAMADLSRAWPLQQVTGALTDFADVALRAALALGARESARRGDIVLGASAGDEDPVPGFSLIAMGKMGAGELNYSSDIDFSVFFNAEALARAKAREPRVAAVRLVAPLVRTLEEVTTDGYVFRTDLRLRPDPGSTPVAVSISSAEHYYQTLGQNWERAAFIKARAVAGDRVCGRAFLASLEPFIWRKHLDFAALEDVHSIKRQILSAHKSAELDDPVFDVKLGRGGIRDIEFFVQTQQLILGGRNKHLRVRGTLTGLDALAAVGAITESVRAALHEAYVFFREVEHRIQMLEDAQTHRVPGDRQVRAHVAALAGFSALEEFDAALIERRRIVSDIDHQLFGRGESLADPMGSLIFTGVEDHEETLSTIAKLGYCDAALVSQTIRGWHHGRVRAMRSERARELLTRLTPRLLRALAGAGDPDFAFARFASFFGGLSAGVQVLSLLEARPALLDLLARLLSVAPRLAEKLARRPVLLDIVIEPRFAVPFTSDTLALLGADLDARLSSAQSFEDKLNIARRFQREEAFRIGAQILEGQAPPLSCGVAQAALAEACVQAMAKAALEETESAHGPQPGAFAVAAFGKFGGRELSEGSDLDIMLIYESDDAGAPDYYARLMQRLISALSAPTEEGSLYEVDTKLRPSGSKGPVAVRLSSLQRYYAEEAWTWELQALTRLRPVAGDAALSEKVAQLARAVLTRPREAAATLRDVADMRARIERERRVKSLWDLKHTPGGFVDIEFIVQALQLVAARDAPAVLSVNTGEALERLTEAGLLEEMTGETLRRAWCAWSGLQHLRRLCVDDSFDLGDAPPSLRKRLAEVAGLPEGSLEFEIGGLQSQVRSIFLRIFGEPRDGAKLSER